MYLVSLAGADSVAFHSPQDKAKPPTLVCTLLAVTPEKLSTSALLPVKTVKGEALSTVVNSNGLLALAPFETPPMTSPFPIAASPTVLVKADSWPDVKPK